MAAELLAPAGNFKTALAAFAAGADAVYCGLTDFSARAFADNFTLDDLKDLLRFARGNRTIGQSEQSNNRAKRVYVTFNTVIDEDNFESAVEQLARLDEVRPDALIVQDLGVARICRKYFPGLELHASTQLVAHNLEGVLALKELGFSRVVLARELSLEEIASIAKRCGVELECFVHGALCYSLSGLCLFGAMEKGRSGNRGKCPYCCRLPYETEHGKCLPFSMKDLRLGEDVRKLVDAGVASLKIEGRMKSEIYVASVTKYYRDILDAAFPARGTPEGKGGARRAGNVSIGDLETVFSRRTTKLYFDGYPKPDGQLSISNSGSGGSNSGSGGSSPIDAESLGHLGAEIGVVKRVTKDRDGFSWLRFHTARALEKHDGLQFEAMDGERHLGMGVSEMRQAISRRPVFEVGAGTDVEILLPSDDGASVNLATALKPGMKIYCSASQAVRRMFPEPSYRPSDYAGGTAIDLEVTLTRTAIAVACANGVSASVDCELDAAKSPEKTFGAVEKAFSKLGETDYRLGKLTVNDPERLFAPMSVLNDLRRDLVEQLDAARDRARQAKLAAALADDGEADGRDDSSPLHGRVVKVRLGQKVPAGAWAEVVVAVNAGYDAEALQALSAEFGERIRLAMPVYTREPDFNRLRVAVKGLLRKGFAKWEASDLATLRMLKALGVEDVTADWTLYAFNLSALRQVAELGAKRTVASPENGRENLQFLAESGFAVEFIAQQSTPLFMSLTRPAAFPNELACFERDGLWVTTKPVPRTFDVPEGAFVRLDLSWDPA